MSAQTVELASAKWLSAERAAELGTVANDAVADLSDAAASDEPSNNLADTAPPRESFLKTLILAVGVGVTAFGVVFLFPTDSFNGESKDAPSLDESAPAAQDAFADTELISDYVDGGELSDAEVMAMAGEIVELKLRRKMREKRSNK